MKRFVKRLSALLLAAVLTVGMIPAAQAAGGVGLNGIQGTELNLDPYDATINFSNVRNSAVFSWPSQGNVLVYGGATYTPTLKKMMLRLDGMVIPANLVVDFYYKCSVTNNATYPYGYTFIAQYDTRDGNPVTVDAQDLLYELDQAFGTSMADAGTTTGVSFQGLTDVRASDYYAEAVAWALEEGVTSGTSSTTFSPDSTVTRGQAVTFLWRAAGSPEPSSKASHFTDVSSTDYYCKPVLWAAENGITSGVSANRFGPEITLAYDQILAMLRAAAGENAASSDWSAAALSWARSEGLTDGLTVSAKAGCPRSDVVYCIWKQMAGGSEEDTETNGTTGTTEITENTAGDTPALSNLEAAKAALVNGFLERQTSIDVAPYHIDADQLLAVAREIADIDGENPFGISVISSHQHAGQQAKTIGVIYFVTTTGSGTTAPWQTISEEARAEAERIVAQVVTSDMSDYDVAKALHDYLILNCDYDKRLYSGDLPYISYTANGALLEGSAVCAGYAKAYEALMNAAGIPCECVTGNTTRGYHAWNLVQIDGAWYHVDTTWDDPINKGGDYIRYDYFLKSDSYMSRDHSDWSGSHDCTSTRYDGLDLSSTEEQIKQEQDQQEQAQFSAIRQVLEAAIAELPFQTQEELEGASYDELMNARYAYVSLDESYSNLTLREAYQAMADDLRAQHPDLSIYYDREHHGYQIYRKDLAAAIKEIQAEENAARQEDQAQNEADALKVEALLQEIIAGMDCGKRDITIEGYGPDVVKIACDNMNESGYRFGNYTSEDFRLSQKWNTTLVTITNDRWINAEIQQYVEQIEAAVLQREEKIVLQPGNYPEYPDKPWYYASRARSIVAANGYAVGGLISGEDFVLGSGKINSSTKEFVINVEYPAAGSSLEADGQPSPQQDAGKVDSME